MSTSNSGVALIAHSGGPTPVINASLLGAVEEARRHHAVSGFWGARFGLAGILNEDFVDLFAQPTELIQQVGRTPASALGSSRYEASPADITRLVQICRNRNIRYFFYTGGNGSMGTAMQVAEAAAREQVRLQVIGIPKTIDNDLLMTDHTPGYASTASFFAHAVRDIGADNRSLPNQVEVIEVLGRNVGWLAAATALAKHGADDAPHLIYLPENHLPLEKLFDDVQQVFRRLRRCVVVVCEGQLDAAGEPFGAYVRSGSRGALAQNLGHRLAVLISERLNLRARSEKPGLLGRSTSAHIRESDWDEAHQCGVRAVQAAMEGRSGVMITLLRAPGDAYSVATGETALSDVAFAERRLPTEWIDTNGTGVLPGFLSYVRPLIGDVAPFAELATTPITEQTSNKL